MFEEDEFEDVLMKAYDDYSYVEKVVNFKVERSYKIYKKAFEKIRDNHIDKLKDRYIHLYVAEAQNSKKPIGSFEDWFAKNIGFADKENDRSFNSEGVRQINPMHKERLKNIYDKAKNMNIKNMKPVNIFK